jgi:DNA-binding FrmR family transcriptional regulator
MTISTKKQQSSRTVAARIHKLAGQLEAIDRMVSKKRPCAEVLAQIEAVRSGLASVAAILLNEELARMTRKKCVDPRAILALTRNFIERT